MKKPTQKEIETIHLIIYNALQEEVNSGAHSLHYSIAQRYMDVADELIDYYWDNHFKTTFKRKT